MRNVLLPSLLLVCEALSYYFLGNILKIPVEVHMKTYLTYMMLMFMGGHYKTRSILIYDEIKSNFRTLILFSVAVIIYAPAYVGYEGLWDYAIVAAVMFVLSTTYNRTWRIILRTHMVQRTLVIGDGREARRYADVAKNNRFSLVDIVGMVSTSETEQSNHIVSTSNGIRQQIVPIYILNELDSVIESQKVNQIVVLLPDESKDMSEEIMKKIHGKAKYIKSQVAGSGLITFSSKVQDFDGILLVSNSRSVMGTFARYIKRFIDILAGITGCLIVFPLYLIIKSKYKKDGDFDPIIFTQERIGRDGKPIKIYKFRTMVVGAEEVLEKLMAENPEIREEYLSNKKLVNDPRVTKIGQKLRSTSLDEFPQFFNVLKGEMSLVGPRPYLYREQEDMGIYYDAIVANKPGVTGMWQANGRSDVSFEERCMLDDYYYKNWNLTMEFIIIYKTIKGVFYGKGAM